MGTENDVFDDPGLKAAIRRLWAAERAPQELRQRVTGRFRDLRAPAWAPAVRRWTMVAAAVLVLGLGVSFWQLHPRQTQSGSAAVLPAALVHDLYARHDGCCKAPDHHMPGLPRRDFSRIGQSLSVMLHIPVLSGDPSGPWDFRGASICPVGERKSAHLLFARGNQAVSLFSLPPDSWKSPTENASCTECDGTHALAAFATANGFYCIVGSSTDGSLTIDQVRSARDRVRSDLIDASQARVALLVPR